MVKPATTKTVRVSHENHTRLNALATRLGGTVDDVITHLMARENLVRVQVSDTQRERWKIQATAAGLPLEEFIAACTESAVQYGLDRGAMVLMHQHVREIRAILRAHTAQ